MKPTQCPVNGCEKDKGSKSKYCPMHQGRLYRTGTLAPPPPRIETCTVEGCDRPFIAKALCQVHYDRLRRTGTFDPAPRMSIEERILRKITRQDRGHTTECWIYDGPINSSGYTCMKVGHMDARRTEHVHRASYREFVGPISDGLVIDHLCCVRTCCNPDHLEAVTTAENVRRMYARSSA